MNSDKITYDEFKEVLQRNAQRITLPRLEVLRILKSNHNPLTMSEIHDKVNLLHPKKKIDLATIYRTVNLFVELKIVSEVNFRDEFKRYELVFDRHHHHHIVCKKCKKIENVELCLMNEIEKMLVKKGYKDISHSLEFFGVCKECSKN